MIVIVTEPVQPVDWKAYSPYGMVTPAGAGLDNPEKPLVAASVQAGPTPERFAVAAPAMPGGVPVTVSRRGVTALDAADGAPVPTAFFAFTVNVYVVPLVRPVKVTGEAVPVAVAPPGLAVTVYPVIALPPVKAGGVNATVACAFAALAVPMVGAPGATAFTVKVRVTWVAGK